MDFNLTLEQRQFRDSVDRFARDRLAPGALKRAHDPKFPFDASRLAAEAGLLGITIPEAEGGQGGTLMDAIIAIETVALHDPRGADAIQQGNFGAIRTVAEYATPAQKERYLPGMLRGEVAIGLGMTEAGAGSAVTDLVTSVTPDGDGWRLNGGKVFTSHSAEANVFLIYCRFGPGVDGIGSVIIERGQEGFSFGQPSNYMNTEQWCALYFDNVRVEKENVMLGPGSFKKQISGFNAERLGNAARARALGEFAFAAARDHALERRQFGRPLCDFQGIQWKFADMQVALESARMLLYRAAVAADTGLPSAQDTALAKLMCNRAGFDAANEAVQIMGGTGYCDEHLVEYCFRKTRGWMIAGGSLEMMRNRIAEGVFGRSFSQRPPRPVVMEAAE
ncbi:acyl-CoA dehydrogenase family protein [Frigidibacter sp. MR17.24]|uniref:acyl-CoA dehydrogenase family protein n=1 Tax=Frigidibacter sp. MR17.24 TaxID=3127345 RepID=UPI003012FB33